jgi:hypothetical protein
VEETARSVTAAGAAESSGLTPVSPCSPHPEVTNERTATEIDLTKLGENTVPLPARGRRPCTGSRVLLSKGEVKAHRCAAAAPLAEQG